MSFLVCISMNADMVSAPLGSSHIYFFVFETETPLQIYKTSSIQIPCSLPWSGIRALRKHAIRPDIFIGNDFGKPSHFIGDSESLRRLFFAVQQPNKHYNA